MNKIGFIGGGNMAEALLKGILEAGLYHPEQIWISDICIERLDFLRRTYGVRASGDNRAVAGRVGMLILCVKPQQMAAVLAEIATAVKDGTIVVSIAAGIRTSKIRAILPNVQVIRLMPNMAVMAAAGASALYNACASQEAMEEVLAIFNSVGKTVVVDEEELLDAVTAVSGSGPAYFFLLMEEMLKAAVALGLTKQIAGTLVLQTAKGAALLAERAAAQDETPDILRKKVTSPGGTTAAALEVFEAYSFDKMVQEALEAAARRSKELSA